MTQSLWHVPMIWVPETPPKLAAVERLEKERAEKWARSRLSVLPFWWAGHVGRDFSRRGGIGVPAACSWLLDVTEVGRGRLALSASDDDLRAASVEAARDATDIAGIAAGGNLAARVGLLRSHCERWGIVPPVGDGMPAVRRMLCARWWLRRLRRAQGRRGEAAAIRGALVRRGLWAYASQDCVDRRQAQRKRNLAAMAKAEIENAETGEVFGLAEIVAGSVANPEIKRGELMTRIRGADEFAREKGWSCEFWTVTTPSRYHAQRITGACSSANPNYGDGGGDVSPRGAAAYLSKVWARARAAWKRRGIAVAGLRTAEPHHDGTPHWHLICYGTARDLRYARRLLRVYALRDSATEPGAKKHRFSYLKAKEGTLGAAYAAKYISKNINGEGMGGDIDGETGRKVSAAVLRVDAWASNWGIRQFQFFGMPSIGIWRTLRKITGPLAVVGSALEKARAAADSADFCGFWKACAAGGLTLIRRDQGRQTVYGDAAAAIVAGVQEGARRALLPVRNWVIHWGGKAKNAAGGFDFPRSGVNNCTGLENLADCAGAVFGVG